MEDLRTQFEELKNTVREEFQQLREESQDFSNQINRSEKVIDIIFSDLEVEVKKEEESCGL